MCTTRRPHVSGRAAAAVIAGAISLAPFGARAAGEDAAVLSAAQALYDEAAKAMQKGDHASACPRFEEVVRLVPEGVGAKLTLARCYEEAGRLASAWMMYERVIEAAGRAGQWQRKKSGEARVEALRPRLATLAIVPSARVRSLDGLTISRDGVAVGPAQWGLPVPLDKGEHVIKARALGKRPWSETIQVDSDGMAESISIDLLEDEPAPPRAAVPVPRYAQQPSGALRKAVFVSAGLGVATVGAGALFGLRAMSKKSQSEAGHCDVGGLCDATGLALRREGMAAGTLSTVLFAAGGVALAGGVTMVLLAPRRAGPKAEVSLAPGAIFLRGAF